MDTRKLGVEEFLDKYKLACGDEDMAEPLDESELSFLDNNNKDDVGVDFLHAHLLEYIIEETLGGQCLGHHGFLHKIGWCEYCSWFQVERTSTWNPHTPCTYSKAKTETYHRIASGRQHSIHKITT